MSKLCDIFWRQCVMGHWQYILYVNTILFVPHCIISLCLFRIPVRIQSFFHFFLFWQFWICRGLYLNNVCVLFFFFSLKKKKKKKEKRSLSSPLWWGAHTEAVWGVCRRTIDSGSDSNITISPCWRVPQQTGGQRSPLGQNPTPPLTDCSLFSSSFRWITVTLHHE